MTDWADEYADSLSLGYTYARSIATALRKAKADGYRAAAQDLTQLPKGEGWPKVPEVMSFNEVVALFQRQADKIEKEEA